MAAEKDQDVPLELLEPPTGSFPAPLPRTAQQTLPFAALTWEDFERLCLRLARLHGTLGGSLYGTPGQLQYGIDFYILLPSGRYETYQCKRIESVTPADIKAAVDEFLRRRRWAGRSDRFVFCTSEAVRSTQVLEEVERQRKRLGSRARPIDFEVWDAEELALVLEDHEHVVRKFFGPACGVAFFGTARESDRSTDDLIEKMIEQTRVRTQFVTNDWASERLRDLLETLRVEDPETYGHLNDQLGSPPNDGLIRATADAPPEWLTTASAQVWDVFARTAESRGQWAAASQAWQGLADRQPSSFARAGSLVSAAIATRMADDEDKYKRLIELARGIDERHPRLVLEGMSEDMPPEEQLEILRGLHSEDIDDAAQITARRAMAQLLTPDVPAARASIREVAELLPGSILASGLSVSVTAQIGRLAIMDHRTLEQAALLAAADEAEATRQRLIERRRWSESTRLLMLKADIHALLGDRDKASRILKTARPEEQATTEQKIVLASSAAERALDARLADVFLDGAEDTPTVVRLRLEIIETIGSPAQREEALAGLDEVVTEGGPEAAHAAFVRLAATLGSTRTSWSDAAAAYLKQNGHERAAVQAEAFYRQQESGYEAGLEVLIPYGEEPWVLASRLRLAVNSKAPREEAAKAAEALLAIGPSHSVRVEAGLGFARSGEFERARRELISVARDVGAPGRARADAYAALMHVVGNDLGNWDLAFVLHGEWVQVAPTDDRSPQWAPRIANKRSHTDAC